MPILGTPQPIPRRVYSEFTLGKGIHQPADYAPVQILPTLAKTLPAGPQKLSADVQTFSIPTGSLAANADVILTQNVPLPSLPSITPSQATDQIIASANTQVSHAIAGLAITSQSSVVYAHLVGSQTQLPGPVFQGNSGFNNWGATIQVRVRNLTASPISGTLYGTLNVSLDLYDATTAIQTSVSLPGGNPVGGGLGGGGTSQGSGGVGSGAGLGGGKGGHAPL
jgi:hypothetical protein